MTSSTNPLIVATGPYGLVGRALMEQVPDLVPMDVAPPPPDALKKFPALAAIPRIDISDAGKVDAALKVIAGTTAGRPVVLIHLAALTDTKGGDEALFEKVNVKGTENVLKAVRAAGASLIHISTDYVFAGESRADAYSESDRPGAVPPGVYAASKFHAENLVLNAGYPRAAVARIAFPYGGLGNRPGLAEKMVLRFQDARRTKEPVKLFRDQAICPSYIPDIVRGLLEMARRGAAGVFHLVGEPTTPLEFGSLVQRAFKFEDVALAPASVQGTAYAANLRLASEKTQKALNWAPTPAPQALREMASRVP